MAKTKYIIVMKGLPGSGKSFLAKKILDEATENGLTCRIHATDDQFMEGGVYKFSTSKFPAAHNANIKLARASAEEGIEIIVIDNINLTSGEIRPYAEIAKEFDYIVRFMEPKTKWANDIEELKKKNVHGVPQESYDRMLKRYQRTDVIGIKLSELLGMEYDIVTQSLFNDCPRVPKSKSKV